MKEIQLSRGMVALVDDDDFEYLNQFSWYARKAKATFYAERKIDKHQYASMHRDIMGNPIGLQIDHIDHNGLNNQRTNLRICTNQENHMNRLPSGRSKYLGVTIYYDKYNIRIRSRIMFNGEYIHIGYFQSEEEAARAYDEKAIKIFGEFANLNFK